VYKKLIFLFLLFANCAFAQTGDNWELKKNTDGVKIYTREVENSKIKAIKVECALDATLTQLTSVLIDIKNGEDWLYHVSTSYVIKQVSPQELYYYSLVEMPWPISNRDFIAHLKVTQDPATKTVSIDAPCLADMVPAKPKIVYVLHADPGGSLPAWLINLFVTEGPSQSFKKLKVVLQKPVYKNAKLDFIMN
jgi:hypothetical protein